MIRLLRLCGTVACLLGFVSLAGRDFAPWFIGERMVPFAGAIFLFFFGPILLLVERSRRAHQLALTLGIVCTLLCLLVFLRFLLPFGPQLDVLVAMPWTAAGLVADIRVRPIGAIGLCLMGVLFLVIARRESRFTDALIHVTLVTFLLLCIKGQFYEIGVSVLQVHARYYGATAHGVLASELITVGLGAWWLVRRRQQASQRIFVMPTMSFSTLTIVLVVISLVSGLAYAYSVRRLEGLHRDFLEQNHHLRAQAMAQELRSAGGLGAALASTSQLASLMMRHAYAVRGTVDEVDVVAAHLVRRNVSAVRLYALDGTLLGQAGRLASPAGFEYALDHQRRLLWADGLVLRSELQVERDGGFSAGRMIIEQRLPEMERLLGHGGGFGPEVTTLCALLDASRAQCLQGQADRPVFTVNRVPVGVAGAAANLAIEGKSGSLLGVDEAGKDVFAAYGSVDGRALGFLVQVPVTVVADRNRGLLGAILLVLYLVTILLALALRTPLSRPVVEPVP